MRNCLAHLACAGFALSIPTAWPADLQPATCPDGVDAEAVRCATLSVPEDYDQPGGRLIDLYIVEIPALEPTADQVALFELAGGPGNPVADTARRYLDERHSRSAFRRSRPVVLTDRRGTGRSNALHCPALETRSALDAFFPIDEVRACRDALARDHDLTQFSTIAAAHDLDRVRAALGYERIDLWAVSYGTILTQAYLKQYPSRVRSAVIVGSAPLDSLVPLHHAANARRSLDLVFFECQVDPRCSAAFPNLRAEWRQFLQRLEDDPPMVTIEHRGERWTGVMRRDIFGEAFRAYLGSAENMRRVPWVVHEAAQGNLGPLLVHLPAPLGPRFAMGLYFAASCDEATNRIRPEHVEPAVADTFLADYRVSEQIAACEIWPSRALPDSFFEPVVSDVPVLLLVGDLDATTTPAWSYQIARGLSNSRVLSMPHGGHNFRGWGDDDAAARCFDEIAAEFYAKGSAQVLDVRCAEQVSPPPFVLPN